MIERRKFQRWEFDRQAKCGLIDQAKDDVFCQVKDINFKGARIAVGIKLPEDTAFRLNIHLSAECSFEAEAWIAWHKVVNGVNHYGIYFSKLRDVDKERIYKFIHNNFPSLMKQKWWPEEVKTEKGGDDMDDRRIFERFSVNLTARYLDLDSGQEGQARIQDLSAKGLRLQISQELKPHTALEVWLQMKDSAEPLYARGQVVWSKMIHTNEYRLGVELEKADLMGISRVFKS